MASIAKVQHRLRENATVIVKFREGGTLDDREGKLAATHLDLDAFNDSLASFNGVQVMRSYTGDIDRLRHQTALAARRLQRAIPSLDLFVRVRLEREKASPYAQRIQGDPAVEYAAVTHGDYHPPLSTAALSAPPGRLFTSLQKYRHAAPDGVDSVWAESLPGGDGLGVKVCVCEFGFNDRHEDLPRISVISGASCSSHEFATHGTATLGVLFAKRDKIGVTGICHGATALFASEADNRRVLCIKDAIDALDAGDVLVLEMQSGCPVEGIPAESEPDVHVACSLATGLGIVVVAAAGAGNLSLDKTPNACGRYIWRCSDPPDDSGAIIVGAGLAPRERPTALEPRSKVVSSCYGSRLTCQAWGHRVATTGDGQLHRGPNQNYTDDYNGTSSATAIIGGVVACLQGFHKASNGGSPLCPLAMRSLLSLTANGTPQSSSSSFPADRFPIGPLPDLKKLVKVCGGQSTDC